MSKCYFFVQPSNFSRIGEIDIDGDFDYVPCKDFETDEPKENFLIFESAYTDYEDGRVYSRTCKEVITGERFGLDVKSRFNRKTGKNDVTAIISSDNVGLYSRIMPVNSIEDKPSRVSGLFFHFIDNPDHKESYCKQLKDMFEEASSYKYVYDHSVNGPSHYLRSQMRRTYKKAK
jgi:hypothetical protein